MKRNLLLIAVLVFATLLVVPQPSAADEKWGETCENADVLSSGTYTGTLGPKDVDTFRFDIPEGDYAQITLRGNDQITAFTANVEILREYTEDFDEVMSVYSESAGVEMSNEYQGRYINFYGLDDEEPENEITFRIYNEGADKPICVPLQSDHNIPSEWSMSLSLDDATPPTLPSRAQIGDLQETNSDLKSDIQEKNNRISDMQTALSEKNRTISNLREQIETLRSQVNDSSGGSGSVMINVTITSTGDSEQFVKGEEAVVSAEGEGSEQLRVKHGDGVYRLGSSGEASIPLANAGEQSLRLVSGDTSKQVSINVRPQQRTQQSPTNGDTSSGSGPGFTTVATLVTILAVALVLMKGD